MSNEQSTIYRGRFAPSPTGPVHFGTLVAAVGSYLQAKINSGLWLMRIEDVDTTRSIDGADTDILNSLEKFGFEWHGEVIYQSRQTAFYLDALQALITQSLVFPCLCSRRELAASASHVYPGTCRNRHLPETHEHALRLIAQDTVIKFDDLVMGRQYQNIRHDCGDFVIRRRDGLFAYQLAVVVDDALQGVTQVVRGADLLDSTPRQIYLQQLLGYPTPSYCHLPLAVDATGNKISKSAGAAEVKQKDKERILIRALRFLGQQPPDALDGCHINDIWSWAISHWQPVKIPHEKTCILV